MQQQIKAIQNLISCPPKIYSQLYLATLNNFIIHCPANVVHQQLRRTMVALKLRQGLLLPKNAGAEVISAEEAQWTYALFSGALLKDFKPYVTEMIIPHVAETWLRNNSILYKQWKAILENKINGKNDLNDIINLAIEKSAQSS